MWWRALVLCAVLLLALPSAAARAGGLPTVDENVLYIHFTEGDGLYFMSNVKDEPDQYIGGRGYSPTCVSSPVCAPSTTTRSWEFPLEPAPVADIYLDESGSIHMEAWIGSTSRTGRVTVSAELQLDGQAIASGSGITKTYNAEYVDFAWDVAPSVSTIPAGSALKWVVTAEGVNTGIYIRMADSPGWSHVQLPITGNGALPEVQANGTVHHAALEGQDRIDLSFDNATSDLYVYNWTVPAGEYILRQNITVENGTMALSILSGNETVYAGNVTESIQQDMPALHLEGNYTLLLQFSQFVGNVTIEAVAPDADEPAAPADDEELLGNETAPPQDKKESPALGWLLALPLLAVAARRRLT